LSHPTSWWSRGDRERSASEFGGLPLELRGCGVRVLLQKSIHGVDPRFRRSLRVDGNLVLVDRDELRAEWPEVAEPERAVDWG
jgi:hypothetical protein